MFRLYLSFTDGGDRENKQTFSNDSSTNTSVKMKKMNSNKNDMELDEFDQEGEIDSETTIISEMKKPTGRAHNILQTSIVNTINQQGGSGALRLLKGVEKVHRRQDISAVEEEEQDERAILPPTSTRLSRRSKKISEMSTGEAGLAASEGGINEDQEIASTPNTPSSSASSSRSKIINIKKYYMKNQYRLNLPYWITDVFILCIF